VVASKNRIGLIDSRGLAPILESLVDPIFLNILRAAQAEYGRVLGITDDTVKLAAANLRTALSQYRQRLREYVVKVTAHVDDEVPETQVMADSLLSPIEEWWLSTTKPSPSTPGEPEAGEPEAGGPEAGEPEAGEPEAGEPEAAAPEE
jgi:hypothetical protein